MSEIFRWVAAGGLIVLAGLCVPGSGLVSALNQELGADSAALVRGENLFAIGLVLTGVFFVLLSRVTLQPE